MNKYSTISSEVYNRDKMTQPEPRNFLSDSYRINVKSHDTQDILLQARDIKSV